MTACTSGTYAFKRLHIVTIHIVDPYYFGTVRLHIIDPVLAVNGNVSYRLNLTTFTTILLPVVGLPAITIHIVDTHNSVVPKIRYINSTACIDRDPERIFKLACTRSG